MIPEPSKRQAGAARPVLGMAALGQRFALVAAVSLMLLAAASMGIMRASAQRWTAAAADSLQARTSIITSTATDCFYVGPSAPEPGLTENGRDTFVNWVGDVTTATLHLKIASADAPHPVYLNGHMVGRVPTDLGGKNCDNGAQPVSWPVDPAWVQYGPNEIKITNEDATWDTWYATDGYLVLEGDIEPLETRDVTFTSSYDGSTQQMVVQLPPHMDASDPPPLLVAVHGYAGTRWDPVWSYGSQVGAQGWILASPELHGERPSNRPDEPGRRALASRASQHDVLDTIAYVESHYPVDESRVYMTGFSMGGMVALVTAAKYPDLFAAVVDYSGPTDLTAWYHESLDWRRQEIAGECGGTPEQVPFEYQRRSAIQMPGNLLPVPLALIHGDADTKVPIHHSSDLYDAITALGGTKVEFHIYHGDHGDDPSPWNIGWMLGWLAGHRKGDAPTRLVRRVDEDNDAWWLGLDESGSDHWSQAVGRATTETHAFDVSITDTLPVTVSLGLTPLGFPQDQAYAGEIMPAGGGPTPVAVSPEAGELIVPMPPGGGALSLAYQTPTPTATPTPVPTPTTTPSVLYMPLMCR